MAGAFLTLDESGWRVTITGDFSSAMPSCYVDKLRRFEGAIKVLAHSGEIAGESQSTSAAEAEAETEENKNSIPDGNTGNNAADEYIFWPSSGAVTSKEIAAAWVIGESTFKQKVYAGIYPQPLEVESMRKLWDVEAVTKALLYSDVQRRRKIKIQQKQEGRDL